MTHQYPALVDRFGRIADDLRLSVTDRCNFRCTYCMPAEGLPWAPDEAILTTTELTRLAAILVDSGIRSIKVTGGEPLVRRDLPEVIRRLRDLGEGLDISLTTNGYLLGDAAAALAAAGLDRVTVSCDSLLRHRFFEMTRRDALDRVLDGLETAAREGLGPVKVNTVVLRGTNDDEVLAFARLARATGYEVRFIEYMPLDAQGMWRIEDVVSGAEIIETIAAAYPLTGPSEESAEPATAYSFADGAPGRVGVIPSVTEPFCSSCNRVRLTADGHLKACLFSLDETDLGTPLRSGADDDAIAALARLCIAGKWAGHNIGSKNFVQPVRSMSMIGG